MASPFKIIELVTAAELAELETFCREPGRTIDEVGGWLQDHGHSVSHGAIGNWLSDFKKRLLAEKFSASSDLARAIRDQATREGGSLAIGQGAILQMTQQIFELLAAGNSDPGDLRKLASALNMSMSAGQRIEDLRREFETQKRAALDEASKVAAGKGATAADVVSVIKRSLGIAA